MAHRVCETCLHIKVTDSSSCENCGVNRHVFRGDDCIEEFCQFLFTSDNQHSTILAHNFRAYDGYYVINYIYNNGVEPDFIFTGSKVMYIYVKEFEMRFIDSVNFFPMPLSKMPSAFGLEELSKG